MSSSFRRFDATSSTAPSRRRRRPAPPSTEASASAPASAGSSTPPSPRSDVGGDGGTGAAERGGGDRDGGGVGAVTASDDAKAARKKADDDGPITPGPHDDDTDAIVVGGPSPPSVTPAPVAPSPHSKSPATSPTVPLRRRGTRPWKSGAALTSLGLRELDSALGAGGGGQPLGSCLLIEEDRFTDLGVVLARYWSAAAVSNGQTLLLAVTGGEDSSGRLPRADLGRCLDSRGGSSATRSCCFGASLADVRGFVAGLPRDQHIDKFRKRKEEDGSGRQQSQTSKVHPSEGEAQATAGISHDVSDLIPEGDEEEDAEDLGEGDASDEHDEAVGAGGGRDDVGEDDDEDEGLEIAWQYRLSIQRERRGGGLRGRASQGGRTDASSSTAGSTGETGMVPEVYCHSYDLSGRMESQFPPDVFWGSLLPDLVGGKGEEGSSSASNCPQDESSSCFPLVRIAAVDCSTCFVPASSTSNHRDRGVALFRTLLGRIRAELARPIDADDQGNDRNRPGTGGAAVIRLLILNAPPCECAVALPLLLAMVRTEDLPVAICLTVRPWLASSSSAIDDDSDGVGGRSRTALIRLRRSCDAVLAVDGFDGYREGARPPEFRDLAGLLTVRKVGWTSLGHFANARPAAPRYGLRRDRRKLHVRMLHLPPEDFSAGGSSVSGGGARTGAGAAGVGGAPVPSSAGPRSGGHHPPLDPGGACGSGASKGAASNSLDF